MSAASDLTRARRLLGAARSVAVLTGAGVSAESGVPTFRGPEGLWMGRQPETLATPEAFLRDPAEVWAFYRWRIESLRGVEPNPGHVALARLETRCDRFWLLTQNVDGLHRAAGSVRVVELHGTIRVARCVRCGSERDVETALAGLPQRSVPACDACGAHLRPAVVWFGEALPEWALAAADEAVAACDVMLVVGTSGVVQPAASFAWAARARGAAVIEVNPEATPVSEVAELSLRGGSARLLPLLVDDEPDAGSA
jgi:NAD-dependent deacetylase